jgi:hypothetical protein
MWRDATAGPIDRGGHRPSPAGERLGDQSNELEPVFDGLRQTRGAAPEAETTRGKTADGDSAPSQSRPPRRPGPRNFSIAAEMCDIGRAGTAAGSSRLPIARFVASARGSSEYSVTPEPRLAARRPARINLAACATSTASPRANRPSATSPGRCATSPATCRCCLACSPTIQRRSSATPATVSASLPWRDGECPRPCSR